MIYRMKVLLVHGALVSAFLLDPNCVRGGPEEALERLDMAIAALKRNAWLNASSLEMRLIMNTQAREDYIAPATQDGVLTTYDDTLVVSKLTRVGDRMRASEVYEGDRGPIETYVLADGAKIIRFSKVHKVSQDSVDISHSFLSEYNLYFWALLGIRNSANAVIGDFAKGLEHHRQRAEEGKSTLSLETEGDLYRFRFDFSERSYAVITCDASKMFNVVEYFRQGSHPGVGAHTVTVDYELSDEEWVPVHAEISGESDRARKHWKLDVIEAVIGSEVADIADEQLRLESLPIRPGTRVYDRRGGERLEYRYGGPTAKELQDVLDDLIDIEIPEPGLGAKADLNGGKVDLTGSSVDVLPQMRDQIRDQVSVAAKDESAGRSSGLSRRKRVMAAGLLGVCLVGFGLAVFFVRARAR